MNIEHQMLNTIRKYNMLKGASNLVVGVSSGVDSMVLIFILNKLKNELKINLTVAHLNHMLRGKQADLDEEFVKDYCKKNNINFVSKRVDINSKAKRAKLGIEECARNERYDFFNSIFKDEDYKIATAHNLSENAETVIFNLARGCYKKGLCGIPAKRDNIIRPLIEVSKEQIINYAKANKIKYREDQSNFSLDYNRNKIRHKVIPVLKQINPNFEHTLLNLKDSLQQEEDFFEHKALEIERTSKKDNGFDVNIIKTFEKPIRFYFIKKIIDEKNLSKKLLNLIDEIIISGFGAVQVEKNKILSVKNGLLKINYPYKNLDIDTNFSLKFKPGEIKTGDERTFEVIVLQEREIQKIKETDKKLFKNLINYDIIGGTTVFRYRKNGDVFKQAGKKPITKTYKKLMQENHIGLEARNRLLVLSDENKILWIENIGASYYAKLSNNSKKAIFIKRKEQ